ncbi:MAG TPA: dNTP triphosphohydrolase, partial [Gemmatales bacterium]|nr:dNTP triphosphohydrolase [Gemmatales bacterium]
MNAVYAMTENASRGRRYAEPAHPYRGLFQRDRDRIRAREGILHAAAFRRLTAKTQVLLAGTNDHHRTRLTHTLEVAQVSRTIARQLGLNEELTEAIALAHDLGHPPFGHAGEAALDACLTEAGGFEHNWQGLRIVEELEQRGRLDLERQGMDLLEERYPDFPGLNLTWEVRESLAFHSKRPHVPAVAEYRVGILQPTLEAQVVDAADSVVYDTHDIDDAFGMKLIRLSDVRALKLWSDAEASLVKEYGELPVSRLVPSVLRMVLARREQAMLAATRERIQDARVTSVDEVKQQRDTLVEEGASMEPLIKEWRQFLHAKVYRHAAVLQMAERGRKIVQGLFNAYASEPARMPAYHAERASFLPTKRA